MFRIAFCDDDSADRAALRQALCAVPGCRRAGDVQISEYACGEQLLSAAEEGSAFELLFLDIYMGGMTGMDTARALRRLGVKTPIVFLTTSPDFALESYDVEALGYLLKPVRAEKLSALMERLLLQHAPPRLALKCGGRRQYCEYDELVYLESSNNVTIVHLPDGQTLRSSERLDALERELHDGRFLRCHKSYLVNMDHIRHVEDDFILRGGERVPIRVRSRRELTDAYYNYFVAHSLAKLPEMEERDVCSE